MENKAISSDLIRGHIDTIILYSLTDGQKTSQQIIDSVSIKSENKYQLNQATLYSSLKRLESLKLISSVWHDSEDGRRKFFALTESGKFTVETNLSNWEYSRSIIDKLIGFNGKTDSIESTRIVEVEKIVEKPVYVEKIIEKPIETQVANNKTITENTNNSSIHFNDRVQEINFRNILNGLIKANEKQKDEVQEQPKEKPEIKSFNETISTPISDYSNTINKIDFSDLKEKIEADGYKLNISSKKKTIKAGSLLLNKLNLYASCIISLITLFEFLIFSIITKSYVQFSPVSVVLTVLATLSFPIALLIAFIKNPSKTSPSIKKDGILYSIIIAFNLILFTVVLNLLFNVDLANSFNLALYIISPLIIIIDEVVFFIIRFYISKMKIFSTKTK